MYAMMKPKPFRIAQLMMIRLSHDRDSCTVRSLREKFINSSATDAHTTAAIDEMATIWVYTSFMIAVAFVQIVSPAANADTLNTGVSDAVMNAM